MLNLTHTNQNHKHTHTNKFISHCQRVWSSCVASQAQHCCLSSWLIHTLFFLLCLTLDCMCFKCVFARVHWPLCTVGELLNSSRLHPSQFSLAPALNRCSLGLLELNHNYLFSSDRGESVHCVILISPLDIKNAPRIQKGNIMLVSWIWLARQNLRRGYSRATVVLELLSLLFFSSPLSFHPSAMHPLSVYFLYDSFSFLSVSPHPSLPLLFLLLSLFSAAVSEYNCSHCACASKKSSVQG